MKPKQKEFILKRASGECYRKIADDLKVSKQTLINWSRDFEEEIENEKSFLFEEIRRELNLTIKERVQKLTFLRDKCLEAIENKDFSEIPLPKLFEQFAKIEELITTTLPDDKFLTEREAELSKKKRKFDLVSKEISVF